MKRIIIVHWEQCLSATEQKHTFEWKGREGLPLAFQDKRMGKMIGGVSTQKNKKKRSWNESLFELKGLPLKKKRNSNRPSEWNK